MMNPSPGKIAVLMSLTGLGLSFGESAQAKSEPRGARNPVSAHGLEVPEQGVMPASDAGWPSVPSAPLDVTLSSPDDDAVPSEEDREAIALAMVMMADVDGGEAALASPELVAAPASMPSTTASISSPWPTGAEDAMHAVEGTAPGEVDLDLTAPPALDVDLSASPLVAMALDLDLSPALDLNLDLPLDVDLRLDRPPVFAVSKLKPLGAVKSESLRRATALVETACVASEESNVEIAQAERKAEPEAAPQAEPIAQVAVPASAREAPRMAPTVVVATHSDRVLRGLEVLLADDPAAAATGPGAGEVFVTSHAEKALLALASTCAGEESARPAADVPRHVSKVDLTPAPACRPAPATTTARAPRPSPIGADAVAMSAGQLDRVRGGFQTSNGLQISFGIERAVYINGALVTTTALNVSDLGQVSAGAAAVTSAVAGSSNLTLIQNGAGNTFVTGPVSAATVGTIVQNTLNDQKIQSVTAINATVNSLQMVRAQNFQSTLRSVLTDALRR